MSAPGKCRADADEAANSGQNSEGGERYPHRGRRFVWYVSTMSMLAVTLPFGVSLLGRGEFRLSPKCHSHQPGHVKRRAGGSDCSYQPKYPAMRDEGRRDGVPEDLIFGPEAAERNDAADRQPTGKERPERVRHVFL